MTMFFIAAAAAATAAPLPPTSAHAQATASIRVVQAVRLHLDGSANRDAPRPRLAAVRNRDGTIVAANVIEFE